MCINGTKANTIAVVTKQNTIRNENDMLLPKRIIIHVTKTFGIEYMKTIQNIIFGLGTVVICLIGLIFSPILLPFGFNRFKVVAHTLFLKPKNTVLTLKEKV